MTTPHKATPNAARRKEASRRAILTAAFNLLQEVGYAKLSIEGIAARAGVGKQTIYRWWPSKGSIIFDAFLMLSGGSEGEPPVLPDTGDLEADLTAVLRATVAELNDPRYDQPMRALATEIAHDPELAAAYAERLDGPMKEAKRRRLRSAQKAGQLAEDIDLDVAVEMIWGPVLNRWLQRSGPLTVEYTDHVVATALNGLRPRPSHEPATWLPTSPTNRLSPPPPAGSTAASPPATPPPRKPPARYPVGPGSPPCPAPAPSRLRSI